MNVCMYVCLNILYIYILSPNMFFLVTVRVLRGVEDHRREARGHLGVQPNLDAGLHLATQRTLLGNHRKTLKDW